MKIKIHTSLEEKRAESLKIKQYMEIGIIILFATEIFCEFFDIQYFDYITMSISFIECGLFLYVYFLNLFMSRYLEFSVEKYDAIIDFHNTFMTSIIIPMIFVFSNNNTSFENTRISDFELLKRTTVALVLVAMFCYKTIHYVLNKLSFDSLTDEQKKLYDRRAKISVCLAYFIDIGVMCCLFLFFFGMLNKEEMLTTYSVLFAFLIVCNVVFLNRVKEKKNIFKISFVVFTVLYIAFGVYDIYLDKSIEEFQFEETDYSCFTEMSDGGKVEQYCRFADGENNKEILKYIIVYTTSEGDVKAGSSIYEFTAIRPSKGIFRWYDIDDVYYAKKDIEKDEFPVVISVSREKTESDDEFPFVKHLENNSYAYKGVIGDEREWLLVGKDRIELRGYTLNKTDRLPDDVEKIFDEMSF